MEISKITLEIFSKLEQQWLMSQSETNHKKTRVLSIDGGTGTNTTSAIPSGAALIHLEHQIQLKTGNPNARIIDFFDIVAGTGIGGLLALLINLSDGSSTNRPLYTAKQAVKLITDRQNKLYKVKNLYNRVFRQKTRLCSKSMDNALKQALTRNTDNKVLTLSDTCKPCIVPCFDLHTSAPFVFSRADACESKSYDFELWKVIRATSCDPSLMKPFKLSSIDGKTSCLAIDGGLVMNNPSAAVVTHVLHNKRDFPLVNGVEDLLVLSLGNGDGSGLQKVNGSGYCKSEYVVGVVRDGVSETVDQMLGNTFCWSHMDYVRIQANGYGKVGESMESVLNERGVESLPFGGKRLLTETNGQRIDGFVNRLVAAASGSSLPPSPCKNSAVNQLVNGR
uniref:probable inactive patatin-like protein 9 n=1 Tax=Erigeron canadensis TaxID=72917 RepID=UPI001CB99DFC|nr:probable inactive patatin-like protein 9 [Erigeron canadensis]